MWLKSTSKRGHISQRRRSESRTQGRTQQSGSELGYTTLEKSPVLVPRGAMSGIEAFKSAKTLLSYAEIPLKRIGVGSVSADAPQAPQLRRITGMASTFLLPFG